MFRISLGADRDDGKQTIVFLHGLLSSHLEYAHVLPFLTDYHILAADLPGHSQSSRIRPFTLPSAAEHVAALVRENAHGGRAHVVGLSAGGFVAMELAKNNPELVHSLFVTGASPFRGWTKWLAEHPNLIYYCMALFVRFCPARLYWAMCSWAGLRRHEDLREEMKKNLSSELIVQGYGTIVKFTESDLSLITSRTLAVAGGSQDDIEATRIMGKVLRKTCPLSRAAVVNGGLHSWDLQFPELFAQSVRAWIENSELSNGLTKLS